METIITSKEGLNGVCNSIDKALEQCMKEKYFEAFGKEFDSKDRKQHPLPLDVAYEVALYKLSKKGN